MASLPRAWRVEAVLHLLLTNTNACCNPTQHPSHMGSAANAGGCSAPAPHASEETTAGKTSWPDRAHSQRDPCSTTLHAQLARAPGKGSFGRCHLWEFEIFFPSKIPDRNTILEIPWSRSWNCLKDTWQTVTVRKEESFPSSAWLQLFGKQAINSTKWQWLHKGKGAGERGCAE